LTSFNDPNPVSGHLIAPEFVRTRSSSKVYSKISFEAHFNLKNKRTMSRVIAQDRWCRRAHSPRTREAVMHLGWVISTYGPACPVLGLSTASSERFRLPVVRSLALFTPCFASFHSLVHLDPFCWAPRRSVPPELRLSGFGQFCPSPIVASFLN
jgi:hypothetical protein